MLLAITLLCVGFVVLGLGAELMVRGSSTIALKLGLSPLVIGLTVVAFGTSAPELAVSVQSALEGRSPLALGNVIGSNIANIGLILGVLAIIRPINIEQQLVKKQIPILIASSILMWILLLDEEIGLIEGVFLCLGLIGFLLFSYFSAQRDEAECKIIESNPIIGKPRKPTVFYVALLISGLLMLVYGSTLFVENAVELARLLGVSEVIIGLSIVAIGTSVPELATSIVAAIKGETGLAVGNLVGSNLFNIMGVLGVTAIIDTINASEFNIIDIGVMLTYAIILLPFAWTNLQISRSEGIALLAGYVAYLYYIFPTT
jgi:cation:H+ antiporter